MDDKMRTYESVFRASVDDPEAFWLDAARAIDWQTAPTKALDARPPFYRWFPDGELNICANALDRHVEALGRCRLPVDCPGRVEPERLRIVDAGPEH